jgi:D-3-phosphoglycerate dehydrogenase
MLALARSVVSADVTMKAQKWEKRALMGAELRGKTLGIVGLGRIGQEVATRASIFGMRLVAHDTFISAQVAAGLGVELLSFDELCRQADYITLHVPSTPATYHLFDAKRLAACKPGVRLINTARGDLIDSAALADAIESGHVAGAGLDVFEEEPPKEWRLAKLPQVVATPHIAGSTAEAQEQVGIEISLIVRDFLRDGAIRNAVNFPAIAAEEATRLRPFISLARRLGTLASSLAEGRTSAVRITYQGALAEGTTEPIASAILLGIFETMLSEGVTMVNARAIAGQRGIDVHESRSARPRNFTNLLSVTIETSAGKRCAVGTAFEDGSARLVQLDDVPIEAPLDGALIVLSNNDLPGVIGEVGTILGRNGINIANFALGRHARGAIGVVNVDERADQPQSIVSEAVLDQVRAIPAVREAKALRLS